MRQQSRQDSNQATGSTPFSQNVALLQSNGYYLHREADWHSRSIAKASSEDGCVVALKYLTRTRNSFELEILRHLKQQPDCNNHVIVLISAIAIADIADADPRGDIIVMLSLWPLEVILQKSPHTTQTMRTQFLEAVSFLHHHKVAHLDLKPENALVDIKPSPRLSLIDFGLSIFVQNENTEVLGYHGTPTWSAPEVGTVDRPRLKFKAILADRWSCGKVLGKCFSLSHSMKAAAPPRNLITDALNYFDQIHKPGHPWKTSLSCFSHRLL